MGNSIRRLRWLSPAEVDPSADLQRETRRQLLTSAGTGLGAAALHVLLAREAGAAGSDSVGAASQSLRPLLPQLAPRAKNVIWLFQNGAPTHVDLFDWKPELARLHGQPVPDSFIGNKRFSTMTGNASGKLLLAPVEPFRRFGQSGATVSEFLPHTARIVDKLCFVHSMHTDAVNHAPAISFLLSGSQIPGRPTIGAWLNYGLGSDNDNLPSFVVMISKGGGAQPLNSSAWSSGFLPSHHQGV
ncbi:MAG: DUF1501 domain-containing protein, partial [Planctomycetaceae bacterium]|nr:DUF1501 domain-containing protein [Planctomycetaceae bacterium]